MHHMQRLIEIPNALRQVIEPLRLAPSTFYPTLAYCADCRRFSRGADFKAPLPINASVLNAAWLIAFSTGATFAGLGLSESISISFRAEGSVAAKKDGVLTLFCHWKPRNRNRGGLRVVVERWHTHSTARSTLAERVRTLVHTGPRSCSGNGGAESRSCANWLRCSRHGGY